MPPPLECPDYDASIEFECLTNFNKHGNQIIPDVCVHIENNTLLYQLNRMDIKLRGFTIVLNEFCEKNCDNLCFHSHSSFIIY